MPSHINKEKTKATIALILDKMKTEVDPQLLGEYHHLFKKEISLFRRSWAAAYLLMLCDQGKSLRFARHPRNEKRFTAGDDSRVKRYPLADEDSKRLFFSVGRSRRVFPREILGLINTKTAIPKEDIGAIRILDNYSFVQVRDTVAEQIIEALNGMNFRGRTLAVNYAKSYKDEENENGESREEDDVYGNNNEAIEKYTESSDQDQGNSEEEDI